MIDALARAPADRRGEILREIRERWGGSGVSVAAKAAGIRRGSVRRLLGTHDPAGMIRREAQRAAGRARPGRRLIG